MHQGHPGGPGSADWRPLCPPPPFSVLARLAAPAWFGQKSRSSSSGASPEPLGGFLGASWRQRHGLRRHRGRRIRAASAAGRWVRPRGWPVAPTILPHVPGGLAAASPPRRRASRRRRRCEPACACAARACTFPRRGARRLARPPPSAIGMQPGAGRAVLLSDSAAANQGKSASWVFVVGLLGASGLLAVPGRPLNSPRGLSGVSCERLEGQLEVSGCPNVGRNTTERRAAAKGVVEGPLVAADAVVVAGW